MKKCEICQILTFFNFCNNKITIILISCLKTIQHERGNIKIIMSEGKYTFCFFQGFCLFFACMRPILKNFGLETDNLFYVALWCCITNVGAKGLANVRRRRYTNAQAFSYLLAGCPLCPSHCPHTKIVSVCQTVQWWERWITDTDTHTPDRFHYLDCWQGR